MPLYDVKCNKCGKVEEIFRTVSEYKNRPECCGEMMSARLTPTNIAADIAPYQSMIDGSMITSRSQHRRHLKSNNCIEVGNESIGTPLRQPTEWDKKTKEKVCRDINQKLSALK